MNNKQINSDEIKNDNKVVFRKIRCIKNGKIHLGDIFDKKIDCKNRKEIKD